MKIMYNKNLTDLVKKEQKHLMPLMNVIFSNVLQES